MNTSAGERKGVRAEAKVRESWGECTEEWGMVCVCRGGRGGGGKAKPPSRIHAERGRAAARFGAGRNNAAATAVFRSIFMRPASIFIRRPTRPTGQYNAVANRPSIMGRWPLLVAPRLSDKNRHPATAPQPKRRPRPPFGHRLRKLRQAAGRRRTEQMAPQRPLRR